jgi:SAM-dependent methyltransferase
MTDLTAQEIREGVAASYGRRVRPLLSEVELSPMTEGSACCAPGPGATSCGDVADDSGCCGAAGDEQIDRIAQLYKESPVAGLPSTVTDVAFGCGNPTAIAALRPGEVVLDLGSGGGIDCFLAAKMVGETGRVIGVDMTPEMVHLAERNRAKVGATNVEFRRGEIEALPLTDRSVDVVISNCVINLSPDKDAVFREAFRVLRPGGRLQVSDMVWAGTAPKDSGDIESWAACVAGAITLEDYLGKVREAGFAEVRAANSEGSPAGLVSANVYAERPR